MSATERLYYHDSHLLEFDARVIAVDSPREDQIAVTLDRTAFYPTGGGQPNDTGTLGEARVIDCIDAEDNGVRHIIKGPAPKVGDTVHGQVDRLRRLDHLQQHTGQHVLSQAFIKLFDAPTHSFRVLEQECEIDIALDDPADEKIDQAVDLANQIIWENRPMTIRNVTSEEAASLPLRKEPARKGELRLIEIADFDLTPCGGTHAKSTGEVGVIVVRSWERAKGLTRIQFMAGMRAVADYRKANRTTRSVAELFSSGREDSPALVARIIDENKRLSRRVRELEEIACRVEAEELLGYRTGSSLEAGYRPPSHSTHAEQVSTARSSALVPDREAVRDRSRGLSAKRDTPGTQRKEVGYRTGSGSDRITDSMHDEQVSTARGSGWVPSDPKAVRTITKIFSDRDADSLKQLALAIVAYPNTIALLASRDGDTARLVFARSADALGDMNALMREACNMIDGRGGGKPDMAQGGGKNVDRLAEAIAAASADFAASTDCAD